jgi:ABC-type transport system substrate-binding protein/tRNA A-37 threonylcarbamoyl transferase component Bud32
MPIDVQPGTLIAGFRVDSLLGEGAMGTVYLAEEATSGQRIALKLLATELARDERFRRRFLRETEIAQGLDHPNVVPTLDAGEEDGTLYLAMQYIEGSDLRKLLRQEGRLDPERALNLIEQVAGALDAAHAAGLVHRDVKPGNILVTGVEEAERAYVCDFGLARHVSSVSSLTSDRGFVGTIDYVPPEQIEGGEVDARADVYSLACVLFECLSGAAPFERESELSVLFAHLNDPPPLLTDLRPELPAPLDAVFASALAKSPDERYSTCGELANAGRAAMAGKVVSRRRPIGRRVIAAAAVLVLMAVAATAVLATHSSHGSPPSAAIPVAAGAIGLVNASSHRVVESIPVVAGRIAFTKRSAWLLVPDKQQVVQVDTRSRKIVRRIRFPWVPGALTTGDDRVWVTEDFGPRFLALDPRSGRVTAHFAIRAGGISDAAFGARSLWLAWGPAVLRIDPRNGRVLAGIHAPAQRIVYGDGALWTDSPQDGRVAKIDPTLDRVVARQNLHPWISDLVVGGGSVWSSVIPDGDVFKLSEDDLRVEGSLRTGPDPEQMSFGGGRLWIANGSANAISSIEQVSGKRAQFALSSQPQTAVYRGGLIWTATPSPPKALPPMTGQVLRISTPTDTAVDLDPMGGKESVEQFMYATCANLLAYPDAPGTAGARLRPEIATAMPKVSEDGRTYIFRVRAGFRFSPPSNEPVTAETFRHTLERSLSPQNRYSAGPSLLSDIQGVSAYRARRAPHVSGIRVHDQTLSITLVKPEGDFLTRLSMFAFCPVPMSIPVNERGFTTKPIPTAGPYYVTSSDQHRTVLERNPNYHGTRPRRSARIIFTNDIPTPEAITLANEGKLDLLPQDFDNTTPLLNPYGVVDQRYGAHGAAAGRGKQQYFLYAAPWTDYVVLNAERPLFRNVRLRRAVNYAIDRTALARAYGDTPADDVVPPAVPGFPAGRAYPLLGSNLSIARRLAGTKTRRARLYWCGSDARQRTLARIIRTDLSGIGIRVSYDEAPQCPATYDARTRRADLLLFSALGSQEPDPQSFLDQALAGDRRYGSALGGGPWRTPAFRQRLARASLLRGAARGRAYATLVGELTRAAPFAVYGSFVWTQYFSPRVGCKIFQGEYGFADLGALCKT